MKLIKTIKFFFICCLLGTCASISSINIFAFGDSHTSRFFCEQPILQKFKEEKWKIKINTQTITIPFYLHWLGPITMHRIGRDGLNFLDLSNYGVADSDIVIFCFGEIDARCHIAKQHLKIGKSYEEIITNLVRNYLNTILENKKIFSSLACVICGIIPPIEDSERIDPEFPFWGTLNERIVITRMMNEKLKQLCVENKLFFLEIYDLFATEKGDLNTSYADESIHIQCKFNNRIRERFNSLILPFINR